MRRAVVLAAMALAVSRGAEVEDDAPARLLSSPTHHESLCGSHPYPCIGVQGRVAASFVQAENLHVDAAEGFAKVQRDAIMHGRADVASLGSETAFLVERLAVRRLKAKEGAEGVRLRSSLQVNGRVVHLVEDNVQKRADPAPLGGLPADQAIAASFIELEEEEEEEGVSRLGAAHLDAHVGMTSHLGDGGRAVQQWTLVAHDSAEEQRDLWEVARRGESDEVEEGDTRPLLEACGEGERPFLAVRGQGGRMPTLSRRFGPLPPHDHVEVEASVHLLDAWRGGTAFARVDGELVWLQQHGQPDDSDAAGVSLCGSSFPHDRLSVPVKVVVPHSAEYVDVQFGGALAPGSADEEHAPALGLDDVAVLIH